MADIYFFPSKPNLYFKKISSKSQLGGDVDGYFIDSDEKEIRRIIDTLKARGEKKLLAVLAKDEEFNRRMLEKTKINFLVSPEINYGKDGLKQRSSGLNHVLAKEAAKNNISILINFSALPAEKKSRASVLSRIIQNIKICRKAGCKIKIASFAESKEQVTDEHSLKAFLFSLGASSQQVSESVRF